jgi:hypothetical protein
MMPQAALKSIPTLGLRAVLVAWVLLALTLVAAPHSQAQPARFTYELCDSGVPGGNPPAYEFLAPTGTPYYGWQNCAASGGAVGLVLPYSAATNGATFVILVPPTPGGFVEGETITAYPQNLQPGSEASYVFEPGWPVDNMVDKSRYFLIRKEANPLTGDGGSFDITMECSASCNFADGIFAHYIAVDEVDPTPPAVTKLEGPLLAGGTKQGDQVLSAEASDTGGGVSLIEARVNGVALPEAVHPACSVAQVANPSYHGLAATTVSPCPPKATGTWNLDTSTAPFREGSNTVQVCASDFATTGAPNMSCSPDEAVEVNNSCTDSVVGGAENLEATFGRARSESVTLRYGEGAEIRGTLNGGPDQPISGATVCVQAETEGSRTGLVPEAVATTDARGAFAYQVAPGPNRQILIGYRHGSFQVTKTLTVRSHAGATLTAGPRRLKNGGRVRLEGRLPEPRAAGRVVVLQANVPGSHRWITFRKATTGERGRFKADYHFTSTTRKIKYRFRALVPLQAGYPWDQGTSRPPTSVTVSR